MQISVLSVSKTQPAGKQYFQLEVAYKDSFGKVSNKKLFSFGAQKAAFDALVGAKQGDSFTLTVVKNAQGYNDWTSAVQAPPGSEPQASNTGGKAVAVKSTYETPEERAQRQVLIVRQSSLSSAVSTLTAGAKLPPTADAVFELANKYYNWVMQNDVSVQVKQDIFTLPNDIPEVQ